MVSFKVTFSLSPVDAKSTQSGSCPSNHIYTLTFDIWFGASPILFPAVSVITSFAVVPASAVVYAGLNVFTATKFVSVVESMFAISFGLAVDVATFIPYVVTAFCNADA